LGLPDGEYTGAKKNTLVQIRITPQIFEIFLKPLKAYLVRLSKNKLLYEINRRQKSHDTFHLKMSIEIYFPWA
jgi:hypothetical protein